jgi:hypothetical protein
LLSGMHGNSFKFGPPVSIFHAVMNFFSPPRCLYL